MKGYARSPFKDFESYLRIVIGLVEVNIRLILKQCNETFVTYELDPGNYTIKDLQEAVYPLGDHQNTLQNKYDDIKKKVKLFLTRFGSTFGTLRFDKNRFFIYYWVSHHIGTISLLMQFMLILQASILVIKLF